jgi:hypothetical protein
MKAKKKRTRPKGKFKALKKLNNAAILALVLLIIIFSAYFTYTILNQPPNQTMNQASSQLKAAIVDQLSLTYPNQTFIQTATNMLRQANYTVDYYSGENVTVDFYRNLPTHGYKLIILRVHSALSATGGPPLALFTSELYDSTKYVYEQLTGQLGIDVFTEGLDKGIQYFGVYPSFVTSSMNGRFNNTIIIMMGCNGLKYPDMAEAFIKKGAKAYISWSGSVTQSQTDAATTNLLQHFLIEKKTLWESTQETFHEVGLDPTYNSALIYYPLEAGNYTIKTS